MSDKRIKAAFKAASVPVPIQKEFWSFYYGRVEIVLTPRVCQWMLDAYDDAMGRGFEVPPAIEELIAKCKGFDTEDM